MWSILESLDHMVGFNLSRVFKVCNGSCDFNDSMEGAGGEIKSLDGLFEEENRLIVQGCEYLHYFGTL